MTISHLARVLTATVLLASLASAAEQRVSSPNGKLTLVVSDGTGLRYRVELDGKPLLADSVLGLAFADGTTLGPSAKIAATQTAARNTTWDDPLGQRRTVPDRFRELRVNLSEGSSPARTFALVARAYDEGVAFRYDLPEASGLGEFTLQRELTEFRFPADHRAWPGDESACAENTYRESKLSGIPQQSPDKRNAGQPFRSVLPLLVETPAAYVAVAESDLLDWAGMFLTGTGETAVRTELAPRQDKRGAVVGRVPMVSPWRVLMVGRTVADLITNDLVATLATPSRIADSTWVKPGVSAWDAWWTGVNPSQPKHTGLQARGDNRSHREYIDFASEMGWPYQLVDWFWYQNMTNERKNVFSRPNNPSGDFTQSTPDIDVPSLVEYARAKNVRLFVWGHSLDLQTAGIDKTLGYLASLGLAGVKIDFINSDSQEAVQWCVRVLDAAARNHLMVDFHGAYKPTGLARTYPNFITQEGVLGNEYNKLGGNKNDTRHSLILPFTRGLLGPMDYTPGAFINRTPSRFKATFPAQGVGTRARQLAMTVVYRSPLLVLCDSPANYRGQPGVEFFRDLPTVWDESVVLSAEIGKHLVIARRSGQRWFIAAMNGDEALTLDVPLAALGAKGRGWKLREFADGADPAAPETVVETTRDLGDTRTLTLRLSPSGGYAATLSLKP
ncbi:MAG TPA: glycoside hydrolase family 97 protein [Rariglobus sp.]|nr:glycoside hydrolase family 97 protein [Rariglobus sp.]